MKLSSLVLLIICLIHVMVQIASTRNEFLYWHRLIRCPNGASYCEDVPSYPSNYIQRIVERSHYRNAQFFDKIKQPFSLRFLDEEENICASRWITIFPQLARNESGHWKWIINYRGHYQGVQVQYCINENSPNIGGDFPMGYATRCVQAKMKMKFLAISDTDTPQFDVFSIPSACIHVYSRRINFRPK